jgi:hypothetical protein
MRLVFLNMQYHLTLKTKVDVKYLETVLNTKSNLADRAPKQCPSFCCICNSLHIFFWAWPFPVSAVLSGKCLSRSHETFLSMEREPCTFLSPSLLRSISTASIRSTLNLKWYILGWPQFESYLTTQFKRVPVSNILNILMNHLVILSIQKIVSKQLVLRTILPTFTL